MPTPLIMAVVGRAEATPLRLLGTLSPPKTRAGAERAVEAVGAVVSATGVR